MMKIVVAIDSMKGCLGSLEASEACAAGFRKRFPEAVVISVPVADGGEGTSAAVAFAKPGIRRMTALVSGPLDKKIAAEWWFDDLDNTAYIDMASAAGMALVPVNQRSPLRTTTFGVGQLIKTAVNYGVDHIVLGLGGSATVDGGLGATQALGVRFMDADGNLIGGKIRGSDLCRIKHIDIGRMDAGIKNVRISLACDVISPFTGEMGAARVFAPQKGASPEEVEFLEAGLENIRKIIFRNYGIDLNSVAGSGAAGGCAGGLMALAGAKLKAGARLVLDAIGFDAHIEDADLVVTGEGSADSQTLMGKLPFEILRCGKNHNIPVCLVAGRIADSDKLLSAGFSRLIDINSKENIRRSATVLMEAMNPEVAKARLRFCSMENFL